MYNTTLDDMVRFSRACGYPFGKACTNTSDDYRLGVNAYDNGDSLEINMSMPGVKKDDININYENDVLKIEVDKKSNRADEEKIIISERRFGKFSRTLKIGIPIENDSIEAEYNNGILNIKMKKEESAKPRKISVN